MMNSMFENASSFNKSLASWSLPIRFVRQFCSIGSVVGITKMFKGCSNLNQDFSSWEMSQYGNISKESIDEIFEGSSVLQSIKKLNQKVKLNFIQN